MEATIQQAGALKTDVQRLERQVADLRIANTSLKANLHDAKHPSSAAGQSSVPATSPDEAILRQKLAVQVRTSITKGPPPSLQGVTMCTTIVFLVLRQLAGCDHVQYRSIFSFS